MKKNFLKKVICTLLTAFVTLTSTSFITKAATNVGSYNAGIGIKTGLPKLMLPMLIWLAG
ncbi:MAG: hypothetical protein E6876_10235 [Clostridium sp.]|nr:hypothetical protein [Clostridium sp.]